MSDYDDLRRQALDDRAEAAKYRSRIEHDIFVSEFVGQPFRVAMLKALLVVVNLLDGWNESFIRRLERDRPK